MTELHLFAGAGGGILGGMLLGHTTVAAVEVEPFCQEVLRARQADGLLPNFPVYGDIREFDGRPWAGRVDVVAGGFPCQDISVAGRGAGLAGERSGLWAEFARVIGEVRPRFAFIENSPALVGRGLDRVLADLAALGMDARWCVLGADDAGAPHIRKRIWILAYTNGSGHAGRVSDAMAFVAGVGEDDGGEAAESGLSLVNPHGNGSGSRWTRRPASAGSGERQPDAPLAHAERPERGSVGGPRREAAWQLLPQGPQGAVRVGVGSEGWRSTRRPQSGVGRMAHGLAGWVDRSGAGGLWASDPADEGRMGRTSTGIPRRAARLKALGNGQVPQAAAMAWRVLTAGLEVD